MSKKDVGQRTLNLLFRMTLCIVIPTLIFTVLSLLGKGMGLVFPPAVKIVNFVALTAAVTWVGMFRRVASDCGNHPEKMKSERLVKFR